MMRAGLALLILMTPALAFAEAKQEWVIKRVKVRKADGSVVIEKRKFKRKPRPAPVTEDSISGPVEASDAAAVRAAPVTTAPAYEPRKRVRDKRTTDHEFGLGMVMWQESMVLKSGSSKSDMETQNKGLVLSYDIHSPKTGSSWYWLYGAEIGAGTVKGKGEPPVEDQFDNQTWSMITARGGLIYRTSEVSRFGIFVPLSYRSVNWVYDKTSVAKVDEKVFSTGGGFLFVTRLTERGSLRASFVRQHMWTAHLWSASWTVEF
jgi:hypothetical protein